LRSLNLQRQGATTQRRKVVFEDEDENENEEESENDIPPEHGTLNTEHIQVTGGIPASGPA
jgi:hypothetical protein